MRFDVAIVGYGPTGALLANLLGQRGLSVVVFERDLEIYPLPRAIHFDGEVMRIFQAAGLEREILGITRSSTKGMHFVNAEGRTMLVRRSTDGPGPHGWATNWYFHQPELEAVLREGVKRFAQVRVLLGNEVCAIEERDDFVLISSDDTSFDKTIEASYVVGCDGARSLVRRLIGSTQEDLGLHQPWLVVDLIVDPASRRVQQLPVYTIQHCNPARPMTACYVVGNRRRWEIMLMPGDDPEQMIRPENLWRMLAPWIGPEDARIERSAVYTFHSVIAHGWRKGRLVLAGDSCHQTPPFLGQGMCAGMRDAFNLAWKLDAVLRGREDESLLDTYESERRPHVHAFIDLAVRLGDIIQTTDPQVAAERDRRFSQSREPEGFDFPQPQLGPGARDEAGSPVGFPFPQSLLADGTRLDDRVGQRFAVIGERDVLSRIHWKDEDVALIEAETEAMSDWLSQHGARAVIVRPDRYVFGIARSKEDLGRLRALLPLQERAKCPA